MPAWTYPSSPATVCHGTAAELKAALAEGAAEVTLPKQLKGEPAPRAKPKSDDGAR